jgi:hypothetical protein
LNCNAEKENKIAYIKESSIVELPNGCSLIADMLKVNSVYDGRIAKEITPSDIATICLKGNLSLAGISNEFETNTCFLTRRQRITINKILDIDFQYFYTLSNYNRTLFSRADIQKIEKTMVRLSAPKVSGILFSSS